MRWLARWGAGQVSKPVTDNLYVHFMGKPIKLLGEEVDSLLQILPYLRTRKTRSGRMNVSANVPFEVMAPFMRALMRREARLLIIDAGQVADDAPEPRSSDQRRADAFVDVLTSLIATTRYSRDRHPGQ